MKRNLVGQFSKRKHYKLPACIKPILLYYYAGVGLIASLYLIGLSLPLIWDEIKTNIKNEKRTIIYSRGGAVDRDSAVNRQAEQIGGETGGADERSNTIEVSGGGENQAGVSLEEKIKAVFPEEPDVAVAIARCESGLDPHRIGDGHLSFDYNGEILGESIGLFQIRTGGNDNGIVWNRASKNGLSVNDFKEQMKNPDENIKYARQVYNSRGWNAWWNCKNKLGL